MNSNNNGSTDHLNYARPFRLGDVVVKPSSNELVINTEVKQIQDKVMKVLIYLVSRRDAIVSREELFEQIWPNVYVSQASLTRCISILRKLLNDNNAEPKIILTVRNQGYRVICPVRPLEETSRELEQRGFTLQTGFNKVVKIASGIVTILVAVYLVFIFYCMWSGDIQ